MSAALLRGDLKAELEELDERYSDKIQNKNKQKVGGGKVKKRYKQNPKVDRLAKEFDSSPATLKKLEKATVEKNTQKLLQLSGNKSGVKKGAFDSIFDQIASSKRHYEPKGRNLLKPTEKKKPTNQGQTSAFTEQDFEEFRKSYFANSAPIAKSKK
jgi:hypothetical protein